MRGLINEKKVINAYGLGIYGKKVRINAKANHEVIQNGQIGQACKCLDCMDL
jgi:hypothetical protein